MCGGLSEQAIGHNATPPAGSIVGQAMRRHHEAEPLLAETFGRQRFQPINHFETQNFQEIHQRAMRFRKLDISA